MFARDFFAAAEIMRQSWRVEVVASGRGAVPRLRLDDMAMMLRVVLCCSLLLPGPAAWADSFGTPPVHLGPKVSIQAYGKQNPACLAWTNGCVICTSGENGSRCSLPGIACQPHGLHCKSKRPE